MITDLNQAREFSNASVENRKIFQHELFIHRVGVDLTKTDLLSDIIDVLSQFNVDMSAENFTFCHTTLAGIELIYLYFRSNEQVILAKMVLSKYSTIYNQYSIVEINHDID